MSEQNRGQTGAIFDAEEKRRAERLLNWNSSLGAKDIRELYTA